MQISSRLVAPVLAVLLLTSAAGCGPADSDEPASSAATSSGSGAEADAAADGTEADAASADTTTVGAAGIGVSDLEASAEFYRSAFGMTELTRFEIPGYVDEIILGFEDMTRGASVVLMNYTDGKPHRYTDNPVKLVFYVPDPTAAARAIEKAGGTIVLEPAPQASLGDAVVGLAKDPDGYTLELLEAGTGMTE